jgi:hypothetical protein
MDSRHKYNLTIDRESQMVSLFLFILVKAIPSSWRHASEIMKNTLFAFLICISFPCWAQWPSNVCDNSQDIKDFNALIKTEIKETKKGYSEYSILVPSDYKKKWKFVVLYMVMRKSELELLRVPIVTKREKKNEYSSFWVKDSELDSLTFFVAYTKTPHAVVYDGASCEFQFPANA